MDAHRVVALQSGDYSAFTDVFGMFWGKVYDYLVRKTHSPEAAKDLTQLVFIKIWKYRATLATDVPLNEQIFRKTKQVFIDWLRQEARKRQHFPDFAELPDIAVPGSADIAFEMRTDVQSALKTLPPKRKEIFELRHIYGYSYKEISELLGISTKTVDSQLVKANIQLRKILQTSIYLAVISHIVQEMN